MSELSKGDSEREEGRDVIAEAKTRQPVFEFNIKASRRAAWRQPVDHFAGFNQPVSRFYPACSSSPLNAFT